MNPTVRSANGSDVERTQRTQLTPKLPDKVWQRIHSLNDNQNIETKSQEVMTKSNEAVVDMKKENAKNSSQKTIDDLIDWNNLGFSEKIATNLKKSIRLLAKGIFETWIIFITNEDQVYCLGCNGNGCLGLGDKIDRNGVPVLNPTLTGKRVVNISIGSRHCIALTANGQCYGWGINTYGQLGIGKAIESPMPQTIPNLPNDIIQTSCGKYHSMALTSTGHVYAWGFNVFGQLGDNSFTFCFWPKRVDIIESIASISCGLVFSLALSHTGRVYVWGINESGQLGRPRDKCIQKGRDKAVCNTPSLVSGLKSVIKKAVNGGHHTLLLTEDGEVYAFGGNHYGQIGNGSTSDQFEPYLVSNCIKFTDIVSNMCTNTSLAITEDNQYYIWGSVGLRSKILRPKLIETSGELSSFDVFLKQTKYKTLFKTIVINDGNKIRSLASVESITRSQDENDHKICKMSGKILITCSNSSTHSLASNSMGTSNALFGRAVQLFNNPKDFDLKFISDDKVIYCRKVFIAFRNEQFWQKVKQRVNENRIVLTSDKFEVLHEFLKYLHGLEPEFNVKTVFGLQLMAKKFDETELSNQCSQYIQGMDFDF